MPSPFPNPPVDINALLAPVSGPIVLQVITNSLVSLGIRADLWPQEGALISCMTVVSNVFAAAFNASIIPAIKSGWLPTTFGNWLTWVALYMYGVNRIAATFAQGTLLLTNNGGGSYSFAPFQVTFQNLVTKQTYTNTSAISLAPGPGTTQTINIQASTTGSASNANPGDISVIVTTMLGVVCTNLFSVTGIDPQSDTSLQLQCWNSIAANSAYGPRQAYGYAIQNALNSVTSAPVNINRFTVSESSHTGAVQVYVASPSGAADPNDVTGVATSIEAIARPSCAVVTVTSASTVADNDVLTVYVTATPGLQASTVQTAVATNLTAFYASAAGNPIGGRSIDGGTTNWLFASSKEGVCYDSWPPKPTDPTAPWVSQVFEVTGATDRALTASQVAVDALTVVVRLI